MKHIQTSLSILLLTGTLALSVATVWAQGQGSVYSVVVFPGYCHKKFPTIREETLFSSRPVLKDPTDGDIVDFYGSCDYDPLGKEEIQVQRSAYRRDRKSWHDKD